ncbi:translocation/assembly module TamB domain-containing protein [Sedimenticola hydrogenitrophicus]|uniref:translocation/assembly module TamB domain-containing protein n=1 Tax=Sedimenticola hydrogenitrophicus TaxID=2967975 RepID=UPI0021A82099
MRRPLLLVLLLTLLGIVGGAAWLLGSEQGNRRLLEWTLGDNLRIERYAGTLLQGLDLQGVAYRDGELRLTIENLHLRWEPTALFGGLLHIRQLQASGIHYVSLAPAETAASPAPPQLPLTLRLDQVELDDIRIGDGDEAQSIGRLALNARTREDTLEILNLQVDYAAYRAEVEGQIELAEDYPLQLKIRWQGDLSELGPEFGPARGSGEINGNLQRLTLQHTLERPFGIRTQGQVDLSGESPELTLEGDWRPLAWPPQDAVVESAGGQYRLSGPLESPRLSSEAELLFPGTDTPPFKARLETRLSPDGLTDLDLEVREIRAAGLSPLQLRVTGAVRLAGEEPQLDLRGEWMQVRWPLLSEAFNESPNGSFRLSGPVTNPHLESQADLHFPQGGAPDIQARLQGQLSAGGLSDMTLEAELLDGTLRSQGQVTWAPAIDWNLAISGDSLNPARQWPEWPGKLALQATLQGGISDQGLWLSTELRRLDGTLQQQPVTASGRGRYDHNGLELQALDLQSGPNGLKLQGRLGERLDLRYDLQAPKLAAFWPALQGAITADGRLGGTRDQPEFSTRLRATGLSYAEQRIGRLEADLTWLQGRAEGQLTATGLQSGEWQGRRLSLSLTGTPEAHQVRLSLEASDLRLDTALQGGWNAPLWRGHLERLAIDQAQFGRWSTTGRSALLAGSDRFNLEQTCLTQEQARLCTSGAWTPKSSRVDGNLTAIPLNRLLHWLPAEVAVNGSLDGELHLAGTFPALTGEARLALPQGNLRMEAAEDQPLQLALRDGLLTLRMTPEGNRASLEIKAGDGRIAADARTAPFNAGKPLAVSGNLKAELPDLQPLGLLLPGLRDLRGRLVAEASLDGDLGQPRIEALATLDEGAANLPQLGLMLEGVQLTARNRGNERLVLEGQLVSGGGTLRLQGDLLLDAAQGWPLSLKLQGEEIQVVRLPEAVAYASPKLEIGLRNRRLQVEGNLKIPKADIQLRELPESAVEVSEDEVIVGQTGTEQSTPPLAIETRLFIQLGDQVRFSGFGLKTRLEGAVALNSREDRTLARGELSLQEGRYRAYGQDLTIQQGRLLFNGPPQNPSLDIRATRLSHDRSVTAVLNLSGNLRDPRVQVSSDPSLPEEEALAYLITGRGLAEEGPGSAAMLRQAAAAKGLEKSQEILNRLAGGLGVDEVRFEEGETLEDTSLLLGKYLSPDLYVSYAVGLFDNRGALVTRYRLSERLRLEVQSGSSQSMDLIYDVER